MLDFFQSIDAAPAPIAFPIGDDPVWINMADPALDITSIPNAIQRKDIIIVENRDIYDNPTDYQILYWLAKSGRRLDTIEGVQTPQAMYLTWPGVPITVLAQRAAPPAPVPVLVTSVSIVNFILNVSIKRAETEAALKGLYMAIELMGTRMILIPEQRWCPLRSTMNVSNVQVARPADYNFMFRLLNIFPNCNLDHCDDTHAFIALPANARINLVALYNAIIGSAASTVLYDINITAQLLQMWCAGAAGTPQEFNSVMNSAINQPKPGSAVNEAVLYVQVRRAFVDWTNTSVVGNLFSRETWAGAWANNPIRALVYAQFALTVTPANFNPLIILEWLAVLPFEWGFVNAKPKINLKNDIKYRGVAAQLGWYANRGSDLYEQRIEGDFPMAIVRYGAQIINALCQLFRLAAPPVINNTTSPWLPELLPGEKANAVWTPPLPDPVVAVHFIPGIHAFRPFCFMTYDYFAADIRSPAILGDALGVGEAIRLTTWQGQQADMVGIVLPLLGMQAPPLRLPSRLNFNRIPGVKERQAAVDSTPAGSVEVVQQSAVIQPEAAVAASTGVNPH